MNLLKDWVFFQLFERESFFNSPYKIITCYLNCETPSHALRFYAFFFWCNTFLCFFTVHLKWMDQILIRSTKKKKVCLNNFSGWVFVLEPPLLDGRPKNHPKNYSNKLFCFLAFLWRFEQHEPPTYYMRSWFKKHIFL